MNNYFNYCNYIGEHMSDPLRVKCTSGFFRDEISELIGLNYTPKGVELNCLGGIHNDKIWRMGIDDGNFKPLIRSISDLTDEELLWMFTGSNNLGKNVCIGRTDTYIHLKRWKNDTYYENNLHLKNLTFRHCNQDLLNRLYSLHVSLYYDELILNDKAVRKE